VKLDEIIAVDLGHAPKVRELPTGPLVSSATRADIAVRSRIEERTPVS
jgi:hypothetical protein